MALTKKPKNTALGSGKPKRKVVKKSKTIYNFTCIMCREVLETECEECAARIAPVCRKCRTKPVQKVNR